MLSLSKHRALVLLFAAPILFSVSTHSAKSQAPSTPNPEPNPVLEFEVATIKPVDLHSSTTMVGTDVHPDGVVELNGLSLKTMIMVAFNVNYWQIAGGEPWMDKNQYNVVGQPPEAIRTSRPDTRHTWYTLADPRLRQMIQTLLIQRFQLKVHRTTQAGKIYLLERTSKPLGLHPTKAEAHARSADAVPQSRTASIGWAGAWTLDDANMAQLADFASSFLLHRTVLDHTGLSGVACGIGGSPLSRHHGLERRPIWATILSAPTRGNGLTCLLACMPIIPPAVAIAPPANG